MATNPAAPKIRGACENCHRRKIRCIIAPGDSACVNCMHGGTACLFAPRSKPGRPKGSTSDKNAARSREEQEKTSSAQQLPSPEYDVRSIEQSPIAVPNMDSLDTESTYMSWNTMEGLQTDQDPNAMAYTAFHPHSFPESSNFGNPGSFQNMAHFPLTPPASLRTTPFLEGSESDDLGFDSALQICKKLDECCHQIGNWSFLPSSSHEVFTLVSKVCTALATRGIANGPCPATALFVAAMLRFLELCSLIVQQLSASPLSTSSASADHVEHLFLLKKIDLLLLQNKVFLAQASQAAAVQKAAELHHHIESIVQRDFTGLAW